MIKILKWISNHLLLFVIIIGIYSLLFPGIGASLGGLVTPTLALMVLNVCMTIKVEDLRQIKKYPIIILWSTFLQFIPMVLFSYFLAKMFINKEDISTGQILLGSLPADISAPLMVYLVGGSTALATAMLITAMLLTPFVLPNILTLLNNVSFKVPTSYLIIELSVIILIPAILGILSNYFFKKVKENEEAWSSVASICYLILLFVVVSSNSKSIISLGNFAFLIIFLELFLNIFGYMLAFLSKYIFKKDEILYPLLFLTSSKEFGIASAAVNTMKLNSSIVIPSAFYAVVQMISLPIMVMVVNKFNNKNQNLK